MNAGTRQAYIDQGDGARRDFYANSLANGLMMGYAKQIQDMMAKNNPYTPDQLFGIMDRMFSKYGNAEMPMFSGKQQQASLARRMGFATSMLGTLAPLLQQAMINQKGLADIFRPQYTFGAGNIQNGQSPNMGSVSTPWGGLINDINNPTTFIPGASPGGLLPGQGGGVGAGITASGILNTSPTLQDSISNAISAAFGR